MYWILNFKNHVLLIKKYGKKLPGTNKQNVLNTLLEKMYVIGCVQKKKYWWFRKRNSYKGVHGSFQKNSTFVQFIQCVKYWSK